MKKTILFICTHNSARSQMAEGIINHLYGDKWEALSAGTEPGEINPFAIQAMAKLDIDISDQHSKHLEGFLDKELDYVITVCGGANEVCPSFAGYVKNRLHMGYDDPSHATGSEDYIWSEFIRVRNEIKDGFTRLYKQKILPQIT